MLMVATTTKCQTAIFPGSLTQMSLSQTRGSRHHHKAEQGAGGRVSPPLDAASSFWLQHLPGARSWGRGLDPRPFSALPQSRSELQEECPAQRCPLPTKTVSSRQCPLCMKVSCAHSGQLSLGLDTPSPEARRLPVMCTCPAGGGGPEIPAPPLPQASEGPHSLPALPSCPFCHLLSMWTHRPCLLGP